MHPRPLPEDARSQPVLYGFTLVRRRLADQRPAAAFFFFFFNLSSLHLITVRPSASLELFFFPPPPFFFFFFFFFFLKKKKKKKKRQCSGMTPLRPRLRTLPRMSARRVLGVVLLRRRLWLGAATLALVMIGAITVAAGAARPEDRSTSSTSRDGMFVFTQFTPQGQGLDSAEALYVMTTTDGSRSTFGQQKSPV